MLSNYFASQLCNSPKESTRKREFKPSRISAGAKSFWKAEREDEKKET